MCGCANVLECNKYVSFDIVPDSVDSCDSSVLTDIDSVSPFSPIFVQCVAECFFNSRSSPDHVAKIE